MEKLQSVGGFNPFEKYARQIGSFPQVGVKTKNLGYNLGLYNLIQSHICCKTCWTKANIIEGLSVGKLSLQKESINKVEEKYRVRTF